MSVMKRMMRSYTPKTTMAVPPLTPGMMFAKPKMMPMNTR